jgi:uncharacterized membrane protein
MQNRWRSKYVWAAVLAQVLIIIGLFVPQISDTVKIVGTAGLEILTVIGILNNPTDKVNW